jgi:hypothetical protein
VRPFRLIAICLAVGLFALAAAGCSRSAKTSGAGLTPAKQTQTASGESSATTDAAAVKNAATTGGGTSSATSGGSSGSTTKGTGTSANSSKPAQPGMSVMVVFWNDTNSKNLSRAEVVIGSGSFKPGSSAKTARKILGPYAYGKKIDVIVYPDGRSGKEIVVPMVLDRQMVGKSEQDAIHVAISDKTVRVLGNAILNVDQSYPRY